MELTKKGFITRHPRRFDATKRQVVKGAPPGRQERKEDRAYNRMATMLRAWRAGVLPERGSWRK